MEFMDFTPEQVARWASINLPNFPKQPRKSEWRCPCPIHKGERDSFSFDTVLGLAHCKSDCNRGWNLVTLHAALHNVSNKQAFQDILTLLGIDAVQRNHARAIAEDHYVYTDESGKPLFKQVRSFDPTRGKKKFYLMQPDPTKQGHWKPGLEGVRKVLYRLPRVLAAPVVYVVEGEKDVHSLEAWGLVATTNPLGAGKLSAELLQPLQGKKCILLGDNDEPGRKHLAMLQRMLAGVASKIVRVDLPDVAEKGDVSDWIAAGHGPSEFHALVESAETQTQAGSAAATNASPPAPGDPVKLDIPRGFALRDDGLFKQSDGEEIFLSGRLEIIARTRDNRSQDWGKLIRFQDYDGNEHELILPESTIASDKAEWKGLLAGRGLRITANRDHQNKFLREYLLRSEPSQRARKVDQIGWHGDVFVTPSWTVPQDLPERIILDDQGESEHYFHRRGTLKEWQSNVCALCEGNSLLTFAIAAAFAPPLLQLRHGLSGGFHFASNSTTGKSTTLIAAGSVWGGGGKNGFVRSWNSTTNGLEALAQSHNHAILPLDELKELDSEAAGKAAYFLANGQSRSRSSISGKNRKAPYFDTIFLSSGEFGFIHHIQNAEGKRGTSSRAYGGQEVRVCEIPADRGRFGSFDRLHSVESAQAFADSVKNSAMTYYGTAAPAFVEALLKTVGRNKVRERFEQLMGSFVRDNQPRTAAPEVLRVLNRFALVAVAGELATEWGVTAWTRRTSFDAVSRCFQWWLSSRGTAGSFDEKQAIEHLRSSIMGSLYTRFQKHVNGQVFSDSRPNQTRWGFVNEPKSGDTEYQFYPAIPRELLGPYDEPLMLKALNNIGALISETDRKGAKRKLPDFEKKVRCTVISQAKLFPQDDADAVSSSELLKNAGDHGDREEDARVFN